MRFSVIIPAKNEEACIGRCLDSLLRCDWDRSDFEVLVIDNGSSDRTAALAAERGARVLCRPGATIAALRNLGAREARGELLAFLDADCTVPGDWLREAARYLGRNEVVCFGSPPAVPDAATWVQRAWFLVRRKRGGAGVVDWLESMNMFVRRQAFLGIGGFDENLVTCEDYDLSLRLGRIGALVADPAVVAVHHGEAASLGQFFRKEYWRGTSNLAGILAHGISFRELPSVALPMISALLALAVPLLLLAGIFSAGARFAAVALLLAWQVPLLFLAVWKNRGTPRPVLILQLFLLLNLYFLARGVSLLPRRSKGR